MKSGKTALYKLLSYENYSDPSDMTKSSRWHFVGYKGEKPVIDWSWEEFKKQFTKK